MSRAPAGVQGFGGDARSPFRDSQCGRATLLLSSLGPKLHKLFYQQRHFGAHLKADPGSLFSLPAWQRDLGGPRFLLNYLRLPKTSVVISKRGAEEARVETGPFILLHLLTRRKLPHME